MTSLTDLETVVVKRQFKQSPEKVFAAFSTSKAIEQWFSPSADIATKVREFDFRPGGNYHYGFTHLDDAEISVSGQFVQIFRPLYLSFTWTWTEPDIHAGVATLVVIEFSDNDSGTELVITHTKLDSLGMQDRHATGWRGSMDRLEVWLDRTNEIAN